MKAKKSKRGKANLRPIVRDMDVIKELFRPMILPIVRQMHRLNADGFILTKNGGHVEMMLSFPNTEISLSDKR
jgi:hypothetical protein